VATSVDRRTLTLYVSDEAYDELYKQARYRGLVAADAVGTRSLHRYIEWLMQHPLEDVRPQSIRDADTDMLEQGMSPEWRMYGPRRRHKITLTDDTIVQACAWAVLLGIAYAPARRVTGAPTFLDAAQCVAAVLEAIGTGWIDVRSKQEDD